MTADTGIDAGIFLSRFPDLTDLLFDVAILGVLVLTALVLALERLRRDTVRQTEAANYGDDQIESGKTDTEHHIPPSQPEK